MAASTAEADTGDPSLRDEQRRDSASPDGSSARGSPARLSTSNDRESRERPVRKKFEQAKIDEDGTLVAQSEDVIVEGETGTATAAQETEVYREANGERGRVRRKRSFEEHRGELLDANGEDAISKHQRKKTRDLDAGSRESMDKLATVEGDEVEVDLNDRPSTPKEDTGDTEDHMQTSPQNKRTREQFLQSQHEGPTSESGKEVSQSLDETAVGPIKETGKVVPSGEPESKRHREADEKGDITSPKNNLEKKDTIASGFGNTSTESPFGSLPSPKKATEQPQTSPRAFASSGFASLADSAQSPFGALQTSEKPSVASNGPSTGGFGSFASNAKSPFASAGAKPSFGQSSGFGQLGGGFASASGFASAAGSPLKSFASGKPAGFAASSKPVKPIGASKDDDDNNESADEAPDAEAESKIGEVDEMTKDERFYERPLETGEEGEFQLFATSATLYRSESGAWKERGRGEFKINGKMTDESGADETEAKPKTTARMLMRTRGSQKLVLNVAIGKGTAVIDTDNQGPPMSKFARFWGETVNGVPTVYLLKLNNNATALELLRTVNQVKAEQEPDKSVSPSAAEKTV